MKNMITTLIALFTAMTVTAFAQNPYTALDNSWITLKGEIISSDKDKFELDFGHGIVTVKMGGWDWYGESYPNLIGKKVTVAGRIDDDFFENTTIEAYSVFVADRNTYYYARHTYGIDISDIPPPGIPYYADIDLQVNGRVTGVDGREFTIDNGKRKITVDTSQMPYNPLDNKGSQIIKTGDRVEVFSNMDGNLFKKHTIIARYIITLQNDKGKQGQRQK